MWLFHLFMLLSKNEWPSWDIPSFLYKSPLSWGSEKLSNTSFSLSKCGSGARYKSPWSIVLYSLETNSGLLFGAWGEELSPTIVNLCIVLFIFY